MQRRSSMEFLPIRSKSSGHRVYAGFWKRFCAGVADTLVLMPLGGLFVWLEGFDRTLAIVIMVPASILFSMYNVFFNARFGGTLGKLAVGIRITKPDGSRIGWPEAWKRSAVDLAFAALILVVQVWAIAHVDPSLYKSLKWIERTALLQEHIPSWYSTVTALQNIWIWSEMLVLLFNKRKRALHDFIAGTIVIKKEFAVQGN
jgi:uncharacterized RDD family membrane protein YckC